LKNIFEQIWAANDYEMFKRMMTQRNVELQLQALELIEQKYGITPESFVPQKKGKVEASVTIEKSSTFEKEIMDEVAKLIRLGFHNLS
jgi:predicted lipid-binding transport protein (Tim44 family)